MAYKFEDKFVHFRYDDSLQGKRVFYADNIDNLERDVAEGEDCRVLIGASEATGYPFLMDRSYDVNWKFVYYDPNYDVKLAYEEGKQIQYKAIDAENWSNWDDSLGKCPFCEWAEYRVKPEEGNDDKVLKWTDLKVGDFITNGETTAIITAISSEGYPHIFIGYRWLADVELEDWRKVKNG